MALAVGLISGTSMDGVDAALVACDPDPGARPFQLGFRCYPYEAPMRDALRALAAAPDLETVARLDMAVGEVFARAALELLVELSVTVGEVECIGSHGQTLVHAPGRADSGGIEVAGTLQLGEPSVIAARTGITTVADFRRADMAVGGQGAPLVPLLDWRVYRQPSRGRVLLNLGGIANITALPAGGSIGEVVAFDTGPANLLLDAWAARRGLPGGLDRDGELALAGAVDERLLSRLRQHPYYAKPPPKSADVGDFLGPAEQVIGAAGEDLSTADLMATLTELTAATVVEAIRQHVTPHQDLDEVFVAGGGVHNRALMQRLEALLEPLPVTLPPDDAGITADAKEAVAFAVLALETLAGRPGNVPSATGAERPAVLGKVVKPVTA